jgi:hypothetical protein
MPGELRERVSHRPAASLLCQNVIAAFDSLRDDLQMNISRTNICSLGRGSASDPNDSMGKSFTNHSCVPTV